MQARVLLEISDECVVLAYAMRHMGKCMIIALGINPLRFGVVELIALALELLKRTLLSKLLLESRLEALLAFLRNVKPATDSHADTTAVVLLDALSAVVDLLDIVEALTRLNCEERKLVPRGRNDFAELSSRHLVELTVIRLLIIRRVESKSATPLGLPGLVGVGQVENVADSPASNDIVMAQQVATGDVDVDGHVSLLSRQRPRSGDRGDPLAELLTVESVTQFQQAGKLLQGRLRQS